MKKNYSEKDRTWLLAFGYLIGIVLSAPTSRAAVIVQTYAVPLAPNTLKKKEGQGQDYIINGTRYSFNWQAAPYAFDFDGNGTTDLTIGGTGRSQYTWAMYVTQQSRNQVWSISGGVAGLDAGSHAMALLGGSTVGPSLFSANPFIGWHNDVDTRSVSILMETSYNGNTPISGAFFPTSLFEQKYLGFRFEREGALHYGWMALSGYDRLGQEIYVYSWAYESIPDTALVIGQIPEPTAPALIGFCLWFGIRHRRRR